ncbi:unnamed protein product [Chilo suppressalis]|uniref:PPIase cyclophilin-type domain-containing protein n=1 Tax=Chilo suppressalis TaxID=168631 RepID=A0ABN8ANX7_CHISP|nr:unnamed protein product [Chilo suppressalis]
MQNKEIIIFCVIFSFYASVYGAINNILFQYGIDDEKKHYFVNHFSGTVLPNEKVKKVMLDLPPCREVVYARIEVKNPYAIPRVAYERSTRMVIIAYAPQQNSQSTYHIQSKCNQILDKNLNLRLNLNVQKDALYKRDYKRVRYKMHPLRERACDELLEHPLLRTPPPEPERPRPPRVRRPRVFKLPPRFPLLSKEFYAKWCNHQKELQMTTYRVDDSPPELFPELYLKPRRLDYYARQLEENMNVNKELLKRINLIQRTGGFVDCWIHPEPTNTYNKLLCKQRQRHLNEIRRNNLYFYSRLLIARSEQLLTKELDKLWKDTKHKLILGASLPFILFKTEKIDRDIKDPAFDKPPGVCRNKVSMEIWVLGGSKIGKVIIELFNDLVPSTCQLFLSLVKGDASGHAYTGTRFFRIVPNLYCRGGDVNKDNGFGMFVSEGCEEPITAESTDLKHSVPGVLSMAVTPDGEVSGQFNIIFKPLPQFDGKHVVFGRIVAGPTQALERISALGLPLGTTTSDCMIRYCGWFTRGGAYREGQPNTIKFPPRRKHKS